MTKDKDISLRAWIKGVEDSDKNLIFNVTATMTMLVSLWNLWHSSDCKDEADQDRYKDTWSVIMALVVIVFLVFRRSIDPQEHPDRYHFSLIVMNAMLLAAGSWNIQSYEEQTDPTDRDKVMFALGGIVPVSLATIGTLAWLAARDFK